MAAKLTVQEFPDAAVVYCDTGGEHPDSKRVLADVERWLRVPVTVLKNPRYSDHFDVARKERFINGPYGAKCTAVLKRELREKFQRPDDVHVWGFTAEEATRRADFEDAFPSLACDPHPQPPTGFTHVHRNPRRLPLLRFPGHRLRGRDRRDVHRPPLRHTPAGAALRRVPCVFPSGATGSLPVRRAGRHHPPAPFS